MVGSSALPSANGRGCFHVHGPVAEVGVHCESEVLMSTWWAC